jgi:hypothetical protein
LAEKGFVVLGRWRKQDWLQWDDTRGKPYLQQNIDTPDVLKALVEGMVFITGPKNKPAVLETITKQFKLSDPAAAEGAYQDVFTLVRWKNTANPTFLWMAQNLAASHEKPKSSHRRYQS